MSARKQGGVLVRERRPGRVYALRFRAYAERQYVTLGYEHEGWDRGKAEEELQNVFADVRRGSGCRPRNGSRAVPATGARSIKCQSLAPSLPV